MKMEFLMENQNVHIVITDRDYERLTSIIEWNDADGIDLLWNELIRSQVVAQNEVPSDVVTMNSEVVVEDTETGQQES
jgi:transcription elongation GreA/GreB family factor